MNGLRIMSRRATIAILSVAALAAASCSTISPASFSVEDDGPAGWVADVRLALRELPRRHKDLYALMPKAEYERRAAELLSYSGEAGRSRDDIVLALSALVAAIGDGHTLVRVGPETILPLSLYSFEEGIVVLSAPRGHPELLGARVESICGKSVSEVCDALATVASRDNDMVLAGKLPQLMTFPFFLRGLGIAAPDASSFALGFRLRDGAATVVDLEPVGVESAKDAVVSFEPESPGPLAAVARTGAPYWYARIPGSSVLYLAYDSCRDDPGQPMASFASGLAAELDSGDYSAVLVDLRRNGGGSSNVFWPVERVLAERSEKTREGGLRVYVAIGRRTYSSAVLNAMELRSGQAWAGVAAAGAVFVGEPSGGKPNHYGEVKTLPLDNLRATLCYSTKRFAMWPGLDDDAIYPDIAAPILFSDYAAGRDASVEAVIAAAAEGGVY